MSAKRILLVHGDREFATALAVALAEEEYEVMAAFDAIQAFAAFRPQVDKRLQLSLNATAKGKRLPAFTSKPRRGKRKR